MPTLTFPDGNTREIEPNLTGADVAASISSSLAKKAVAMRLDGELCDLTDAITADARIQIVLRDDEDALELIRHDSAHIMAEAVQELYPGTQATIGPVIENGFYYDFERDEPFTPDDFGAIEKKMREIIRRNHPFTKEIWPRDKAIQAFAEKGETYKVELVEAIPEDQELKIYRQGNWFDLCRGPHMPSTGKIGNSFKLMKVAGAYWRGDSNNRMLTRIYGTAWANEKQLKAYLFALEEAEKRDHRRLGREMGLFHFQEEAPGSVFWHPKGWTLFRTLIDYMRRRQNEAGYGEVNTPDMMDRALWEKSGHWEKFRKDMFTTQTEDERLFAFKPMNCPGHVQIFKHGLKSYRDLPMKLSEFGKVHRYEPSGALHGLLRVRSFTQDDAHIFCSHEQITEECLKVHRLMLSIYKDFGFDNVAIKFSDRPETRVGSDAVWDAAENALKTAVDAVEGEVEYNPGEGAFYGPKLEYVLRDAIGRDWQCGTLQVDFNLPGRLGAFYVDSKGEKTTPVMLHRAMFGSLERFAGILVEHLAGHFPLWLAPQQAVVCPITSEANDYALHVAEKVRAAGLYAQADLRNEKINYKIREHSVTKIPVILVVGMREVAEQSVNIRRLGSKEQTAMSLNEALACLTREATPPDMR